MTISKLVPLCVVSLLFAAPAPAQELGLDLSEPLAPAEYQPALLFLGVFTQDTESGGEARRKAVEELLVKTLTGRSGFSRVAFLKDLPKEQQAGADTCVETACLKQLASKNSVQRVLSVQLTRVGPDTKADIFAMDIGQSAPANASALSTESKEAKKLSAFAGLSGRSASSRDREFAQRTLAALLPLLDQLATPLGKLVVDCIEPNAVATLDGAEVGKGSFSVIFPKGRYALHIAAEGYAPVDQPVDIQPGQATEVKITLVALAIERAPIAAVDTSGPGAGEYFTRPGVYIAAAGVVATIVGFAMGASAQATAAKAVDANHDGAVDISRAEAAAARTQATMANVLVPVGLAAVAGGAIWFFLTPRSAPDAPLPVSPTEATDAPSSGFMLGFGGTFP